MAPPPKVETAVAAVRRWVASNEVAHTVLGAVASVLVFLASLACAKGCWEAFNTRDRIAEVLRSV